MPARNFKRYNFIQNLCINLGPTADQIYSCLLFFFIYTHILTQYSHYSISMDRALHRVIDSNGIGLHVSMSLPVNRSNNVDIIAQSRVKTRLNINRIGISARSSHCSVMRVWYCQCHQLCTDFHFLFFCWFNLILYLNRYYCLTFKLLMHRIYLTIINTILWLQRVWIIIWFNNV